MTFALLYHDLAEHRGDATGDSPLPDRYTVALADFREHLAAIASTGTEVGLIRPGAPAPAVALTFDDGGDSALAAADELERHGWRGHFFVTTDRLERPGFLTAAGVAELVARGHDVGSHSHTHPTYMGRLSRTQLELEWQRSRDILSAVIGVAPGSASVPGGYLSDAVIETAAAAGFRLLMTSDPTSTPIQRGEMTVLGRYSIRATTSTEQAVRYASGDRRARARLVVEWRAKQLAKRVSPRLFEAARRRRPVRSARR